MKYTYQYSTIASDFTEVDDLQQAEHIVELLEDGWEIYSSVAVTGGIHYIFRKEMKAK